VKGPLILFGLLAILGCLMWWALVGDEDADMHRGREETDITFGMVADEIRGMDEAFQHLTRQGFMLNWRRQHEELRSGLAELRAHRVEVETRQDLSQRERLSVFRELVDASDSLLAQAVSLRRKTQARYDFMLKVSPLLQKSRNLRDLLADADSEDSLLRTRRDSLAGTFANLEQGAKIADNVLIQNLTQGTALGETEVRNLIRLIEQQEKLVEAMGLEEALPGS
jgi:hypothetical protein